MAAAHGRYNRVIKYVKEAEDLARSGALVLDDGAAAIYFLWGQPSHAYIHQGDEVIEGEAALKEITLDLKRPGKVEWRGRDVLQVETLRCNAQDLLEILETMSVADSAPPPMSLASIPQVEWDGVDRRREAPEYSLDDFPFLPTGPPLWADVPTNVVHLDVLLSALPTVLVAFEGSGIRAAGLVYRGELYDAIYVTDAEVKKGRQAWNEIMDRPNGMVSAFELDEDLAEALPTLWRSKLLYSDLDARWFDAREFLESQRGEPNDRAVVVSNEQGMGVAVFLRGRVAGVYTSEERQFVTSLDPLVRLLAQKTPGRVAILERMPDDMGEPFVVRAPTEDPYPEEGVEGGVPAPQPQSFVQEAAGPEVVHPEWYNAAAVTSIQPEPVEEPPSAELSRTPAEEPDDQPLTTGLEDDVFPTRDLAFADLDPADLEQPTAVDAGGTEDHFDVAEQSAAAEWMTPHPEAFPVVTPEEQPSSSSAEREATEEMPAAEQSEPESPLPSWANVATPVQTTPSAGHQPSSLFDFSFVTEGNNPPADASATPLDGPSMGVRLPEASPEQPMWNEVRLPEASPEQPVWSEVDYTSVLGELGAIGERFLGSDFASLRPLIDNCAHSAAGARQAIAAIRTSEVAGRSPAEIDSMARAMLLFVADRLSAT